MDRRNRKTKKAIYNAMSEILLNKQLNFVTMTELSKEADINRSTLYSYYNNPNDVFIEMVDVCLQDFEKSLQGLKYIMTDFIRIYLEYMKENQGIFLEIHRSNIENPNVKRIADIMNSHINGIKLIPEKIMTKYCFYGFFGITAEWLKAGCNTKIDSIIEELIPIMRVFEKI